MTSEGNPKEALTVLSSVRGTTGSKVLQVDRKSFGVDSDISFYRYNASNQRERDILARVTGSGHNTQRKGVV